MYILKEFVVEGLWGNLTAKLNFNDDVNFLIGENSSGKTTLIYLLSSLLNLDEMRIKQFKFKDCTIRLVSKNSNKSIELKCINGDFFKIIFIDENGGKFIINNEKNSILLNKFLSLTKQDSSNLEKSEYVTTEELKNKISGLVSLTWLSIHRNTENYQIRDTYYQPIDQRLSSIKSSLMKYFSVASQKYEEEVSKFQKNIFLEFIDPSEEININEIIDNLDLVEAENDIRKIFDMLKINNFEDKLEKLFFNYNEAVEVLKSKGEMKFKVKNYVGVYNLVRVSAIIKSYNSLKKKRDAIYSQQNKFLEVLNLFFKGTKKAYINNQNELTFTFKQKNQKGFKNIDITLEELSSGEKQIIILLAETLLQDKKTSIFIADEPELSLHLKWQELLTTSIRNLNPNGQILFATHSPDIISFFDNKIIKMQDVLK